MQEIMQYTTYGIALIGGLAFLVAIIVQVLKELPKLKKIPTSVVALVVSLILCPVTLIALCRRCSVLFRCISLQQEDGKK